MAITPNLASARANELVAQGANVSDIAKALLLTEAETARRCTEIAEAHKRDGGFGSITVGHIVQEIRREFSLPTSET